MTFRIERGQGEATPLIVEIPHAGLRLDAESLAFCIAPGRAIGQDADLYVDDLYQDATSHGATRIVAEMSRYVCDLNRHEADFDADTGVGGRSDASAFGVVWRRTTEGYPALRAPLPASELERRLSRFYRPYHRAFRGLIEETRARFGYALVLCAHSMPSLGRGGEPRADVVPGTRGRTSSSPGVIALVERACEDFGYTWVHDQPYRGGFSTEHYGRPLEGVHAIQVELARRLYMDETALAKNSGFDACRRFCSHLVQRLTAFPAP